MTVGLLSRIEDWLRRPADADPERTEAMLIAFLQLVQQGGPEYPLAVEAVLREIASDWQSRWSAGFVIGMLQGLEEYDDGRALPYVERLETALARTGPQMRVLIAARRCGRVLRAGAARNRANDLLLRPATSAEPPSGTLLRPAHGAADGDADRLLRPPPDGNSGPPDA